jgi:hypothetical protein
MLRPPDTIRWLAFVLLLLCILVGCQTTSPVEPSSPLGTPSPIAALESPLASVGATPDLVLFQQATEASEESFSVQFDQTLWEYANGHVYGPSLVHHHLIGCALVLGGGAGDQPTRLRTIALAGREWDVSATGSGTILYHSPPFAFFLTSDTFESLMENKPCQQAGEAVIATFTPLPAAAPPIVQVVGGSRATEEPWVMAESQKGGFRFRHPASWSVVESAGWGVIEWGLGTIELQPPAGQRQDRIWLSYLDFEKPEEANLHRWVESYLGLGLGPPRSPSLSRIQLTVIDPLGPSQQLYNEEPPAIRLREYYITHGRLVLHLSHGSQRVGQEEVLRRVADSIEFTADAPATLTQLYSPNRPPRFPTIEGFWQWMTASPDATKALDVRTQTGQAPTALLATMSEQTRAEYERLLIHSADYINLMEQQRAAQASLSPLPTPNP